MSDLLIDFSAGEIEIEIENGLPKVSGGLSNAVYLSLFTGDWWGNSQSENIEKYNSEIPRILEEGILTNTTRLDVIEAAKTVLSWMADLGIAERIDVDAEIPRLGVLYLSVKIYEPKTEDPEQFAYSLNWDSQEVLIR